MSIGQIKTSKFRTMRNYPQAIAFLCEGLCFRATSPEHASREYACIRRVTRPPDHCLAFSPEIERLARVGKRARVAQSEIQDANIFVFWFFRKIRGHSVARAVTLPVSLIPSYQWRLLVLLTSRVYAKIDNYYVCWYNQGEEVLFREPTTIVFYFTLWLMCY